MILENYDREMIYNQKISIILDYEKNYINLSIDDEKIFSMMIEYNNSNFEIIHLKILNQKNRIFFSKIY